SSGSDLDKQKLAEKVRAALNRLRRLGMIHGVGEQNSGKFTIAEAVFRFGAEVRAGDDPREAQLRLIRDGEAATPDSLALEKQAD
ncbi:condesin subunit E, partial [Pasteurella multocida subsp. multocida str. Anand1_cattle]